MINYRAGSIEFIDEIKNLWKELGEHHAECSTYFSDEMSAISYDVRKKSFYEDGKDIFIIIAEDENKKIGYIVSSTIAGVGEIESIYVSKEYRRQNIGETLMTKALNWFAVNNVDNIHLHVAVGNEQAFDFYSRFGFYPRVTKLVRKRSAGHDDED